MHTVYGDFTAHTKAGDFTFYPSFENMAKIGTPSEIIDVFSSVHMISFNDWLSNTTLSNNGLVNQAHSIHKNLALESAKLVLQSCCSQDVTPLVGGWKMGITKMYGQIGFETNPDKILTIAKHLLFHGIVGKSDKKETNKYAKKSTEFHADHFVTMARRHLNVGRDEAWSMTMTELIKEIEAITPDRTDDNGAPTDEQYDEVMRMVANIERAEVNNG